MFTGIVEEIGTVKTVTARALSVRAKTVLEDVKLGDSIAVNGVCLTVTSFDGAGFAVELMPETLRRSNLGSLNPGDPINLERAVAVGSRVGGHFVQGHIDGQGTLLARHTEQEALIMRFATAAEIMSYIVPKGFIAVDGASLTVVDCDDSSFSVSLVGFTQEHIILPAKRPGYLANLEVDILGKYVEKLVSHPKSRITEAFLAEHGFSS